MLPGYHMFFRKQCWHLVAKWVNLGLMNALKYLWCETSLLSQAVLKHAVSKDFIFKKSVQGTGSVSCQEWRYLVIASYISKFLMSCMFSSIIATATFKKKTSTCGSQVGHNYVGHIRIVLWVSGSTGVTHFQPWSSACMHGVPSSSWSLNCCMHVYYC